MACVRNQRFGRTLGGMTGHRGAGLDAVSSIVRSYDPGETK
jgi:hypothetical protein